MEDQRNAYYHGGELPGPPLASPKSPPEGDEQNAGKYQQRPAAMVYFQRKPFGPGARIKGMSDTKPVDNIKRATQHYESSDKAVNKMRSWVKGHGVSVCGTCRKCFKPGKCPI